MTSLRKILHLNDDHSPLPLPPPSPHNKRDPAPAFSGSDTPNDAVKRYVDKPSSLPGPQRKDINQAASAGHTDTKRGSSPRPVESTTSISQPGPSGATDPRPSSAPKSDSFSSSSSSSSRPSSTSASSSTPSQSAAQSQSQSQSQSVPATSRQSTRDKTSNTMDNSAEFFQLSHFPPVGLQRPFHPHINHANIPIKLTPKTRRISRAQKGLPVHVCDLCNPFKTFTRAEHLRYGKCLVLVFNIESYVC